MIRMKKPAYWICATTVLLIYMAFYTCGERSTFSTLDGTTTGLTNAKGISKCAVECTKNVTCSGLRYSKPAGPCELNHLEQQNYECALDDALSVCMKKLFYYSD